jgi:uncharacterized RDD family membrane protein YckC
MQGAYVANPPRTNVISIPSDHTIMDIQPLFVPGGFGPLEMGVIFLLLIIILSSVALIIFILGASGEQETDEKMPIAPVSLRVVSALIDLLVITFLAIIAGGLLAVSPVSIDGILYNQIFILFIFLAYFSYMEAEYGYTVGKSAMNIHVVTESREEIDWKAAILRNLIRPVDYLPNLYLLGFIVIVVTEKNQRIGDGTANTIVVKKQT